MLFLPKKNCVLSKSNHRGHQEITPNNTRKGFPLVPFGVSKVGQINVFDKMDWPEIAIAKILISCNRQSVLDDPIDLL